MNIISEKHSRTQIYWDALCSLLISLLILISTSLVTSIDNWYSGSLPHRLQTESLLKGHLAVAENAWGMNWDLAYGVDGKIHQVWGLGVPLWRLPFEALARLAGQPAFPDRLCFGLALACMIFLVIRLQRSVSAAYGKGSTMLGWLATVPLILFPPFISLCSSRFRVYEEVIAYGFIAAIILMMLVIRMRQKPSSIGFIILALFSGLIASIRPIFIIYGGASLIMATAIFWRNTHRIKIIGLGLAAFFLMIGILLWSNNIRFGAPLEFGHSLNLHTDPINIYTSRFDSPYRNEPITGAGKELFAILFLTRPISAKYTVFDGVLNKERFPGQSPTIRWRELYFKTYDISFFVMLLAVWAWFGYRLYLRFYQKKKPDNHNFLELGAWWSCLTIIPFGLFYLRLPFISSRYLLDFGSAFAVIAWIFWSLVYSWIDSYWRHKKMARLIFILIMLSWCSYELATINPGEKPVTCSKPQILQQMENERKGLAYKPFPESYSNGFSVNDVQIHYNSTGWDPTGMTAACVVLFVENPDCFIIDINPLSRYPIKREYYDCIKAKIGLEFLERESLTTNVTGARIVFKGPKKKQYQKGIQVVFLAMVPPQELQISYSQFRLLKVYWHRNTASSK
jgi:hypothetical protein